MGQAPTRSRFIIDFSWLSLDIVHRVLLFRMTTVSLAAVQVIFRISLAIYKAVRTEVLLKKTIRLTIPQGKQV